MWSHWYSVSSCFECPHFQHERCRFFSSSVLAAASSFSAKFNLGLFPQPKYLNLVGTSDFTFEFVASGISVGPRLFDDHLDIFVDGSTSNPRHTLTASGGLSLTQYDVELNHVLSVFASIPKGFSQSAASCERHALVIANMCC